MAFRKFNTGTWHDPDFEKMEPLERYLFIYLWTNEYCNQSGIYEITIRRMSFETKIEVDTLQGMLNIPIRGVQWDAKKEVVWVVNFLKHQCQNKDFFFGAFEIAKKYPDIIQDFVKINKCLFTKYNIDSDYTLEPPLKGSANAETNLEHNNNLLSVSASASGEFSFRKKVPLPDDFYLTDQMIKYAKDKNIRLNLNEFTEGFIISCKQHGYKYKDWYATWQTWLRGEWKKHMKANPLPKANQNNTPLDQRNICHEDRV